MGAESAAFADAVRAVLDGKSYEALAVEFTRLFGGLSASYGGLPPIESVVRSGSWGGDVVLGVVASYDEAEIAPPLPEATPPDHLTAELRFLAIACQRESEAWQALDRVQARRWLDCQRGFLDQHVLRWLPAYCQTKIALTETPFYRALLTLAPLACALDREDIDTIVASLRNDA
jgi:TorA maturation chaperone TorD